MAQQPRQHKLVIEAICSMADHPFSGFEVSRRTAVPRSSVTRVMANLQGMGLLVYRPGGPTRKHLGRCTWRTTPFWTGRPEEIIPMYEQYLKARNDGLTNGPKPGMLGGR